MQTRKLISTLLLCVLLFLALFSVSAYAETESGERVPYYVSDEAHLLSVDAWTQLEAEAERISKKYQCGVYIATVPDYTEYGSYSSFWSFSEDFYNNYHLGIGEKRNGILLILSMAERDYSLIAYGSDAHYAFTDYGKEVLENEFLDDFRRDDWAGGFGDYLSMSEQLLASAAAGEPVDVPYTSRGESRSTVGGIVTVFVPLLTAFGACEGMRRQMKPVSRQSRADEYIVQGGIDLSLKRDVFLNRTITRVPIRSVEKSPAGGGGTTVNSHGFSGHSGKF